MLERVKDVLKRSGVLTSQDKIYLTSSLSKDLDIDSLQIIQVIIEMEKEFEVEIADIDVKKIVTVADLMALITKK
jgi:acyl carrier protein